MACERLGIAWRVGDISDGSAGDSQSGHPARFGNLGANIRCGLFLWRLQGTFERVVFHFRTGRFDTGEI